MSTLRILSIDGGGIRGIIPAYWLTQLEEQVCRDHNKASLSDLFDLYIGTSTGGIIACAIAIGIPAQTALNLYEHKGRRVFSRTFTDMYRLPVLRPRYRADGLSAVLKETFQDRLLDEVKKPKRLLVTTFDAKDRRPILFDSWKPAHAAMLMREVCQATASAPTYFPAHVAKLDNVDVPLLDGGVSANNPAAMGLAKAINQGHPPDNIVLVSLGTGESKKGLSIRQARKWGWGQWAGPIVGTLFDGASGANEELLNSVLTTDNYFRFQCSLPTASPALDDATPRNIARLMDDARTCWNDYKVQHEVKAMVGRLVSPSPPPLHPVDGEWTSNYTWNDPESNAPCEESGVVRIAATGRSVSGQTLLAPDADPNATQWNFFGRFDDHHLVGEWKSLRSSLTGTFVLRLNVETNRAFDGYWIGTGDRGIYHGRWELHKKP